MISTTHHLQATIKRALEIRETEAANDIDFNITIQNIDESVLVNYCKENEIEAPTRFNLINSQSYLYVNFRTAERVLVGLSGVHIQFTNEEDHTN
tara:strand:- start:181 stop:465 length:285 start_codon:yes stop_codon:yes gene_type:complete